MNIAVVGATGLVGSKVIQTLEAYNLKIDQLLPVASQRSVGKVIQWKGNDIKVISLQDAINAKPDVAIFSAGGSASLEWAPKFADAGIKVVDNSSAWRMDPTKKLIVPEVNASELSKEDMIIANPNCSTIQMVVALNDLEKAYNIKRLVISTYQSVTGTGKKAVDQLMNERANIDGDKAYPHPIDLNILPHIDVFTENGYTKEEMKMINETRKIMNRPDMAITATTVRVPVIGGHSESVNVEFEKPFDLDEAIDILSKTKGVTLQDDVSNNVYPMPIWSHDKDDVFVGRIRRDESRENTLNLWIVSDNLRKGAATNAIQIVEYLHAHQML